MPWPEDLPNRTQEVLRLFVGIVVGIAAKPFGGQPEELFVEVNHGGSGRDLTRLNGRALWFRVWTHHIPFIGAGPAEERQQRLCAFDDGFVADEAQTLTARTGDSISHRPPRRGTVPT